MQKHLYSEYHNHIVITRQAISLCITVRNYTIQPNTRL